MIIVIAGEAIPPLYKSIQKRLLLLSHQKWDRTPLYDIIDIFDVLFYLAEDGRSVDSS